VREAKFDLQTIMRPSMSLGDAVNILAGVQPGYGCVLCLCVSVCVSVDLCLCEAKFDLQAIMRSSMSLGNAFNTLAGVQPGYGCVLCVCVFVCVCVRVSVSLRPSLTCRQSCSRL
jgi:hypothetical protein